MIKHWGKGFIYGIPLGFFILILMNMSPVVLFFIIFLIVLPFGIDWSGQGDGREGCNLHTTCNH